MPRKLVLDSNLALLQVVGALGPEAIRKHKRLQSYDAIDYKILVRLLGSFNTVLFSPNVLSETSNLVRYAKDPIKSLAAARLAAVIEETDEIVIPSRTAARHAEYAPLGLTDAVMLAMAADDSTLLTADLGP